MMCYGAILYNNNTVVMTVHTQLATREVVCVCVVYTLPPLVATLYTLGLAWVEVEVPCTHECMCITRRR